MTFVEALALVRSRGLFVSAGPQPRPAKDKRKGPLMSWVVAAKAIDSPRGVGETLLDAVRNLLAIEAEDTDLL